MYKVGGKKKLGKKDSHRRSMIKNQLRSLVQAGKVVTTTPKAKVLKANADSFLAKYNGAKNDTKVMRELKTFLGNKLATKAIEVANNALAVRIMKVGHRDGDNAELSEVKIVTKDEA